MALLIEKIYIENPSFKLNNRISKTLSTNHHSSINDWTGFFTGHILKFDIYDENDIIWHCNYAESITISEVSIPFSLD